MALNNGNILIKQKTISTTLSSITKLPSCTEADTEGSTKKRKRNAHLDSIFRKIAKKWKGCGVEVNYRGTPTLDNLLKALDQFANSQLSYSTKLYRLHQLQTDVTSSVPEWNAAAGISRSATFHKKADKRTANFLQTQIDNIKNGKSFAVKKTSAPQRDKFFYRLNLSNVSGKEKIFHHPEERNLELQAKNWMPSEAKAFYHVDTMCLWIYTPVTPGSTRMGDVLRYDPEGGDDGTTTTTTTTTTATTTKLVKLLRMVYIPLTPSAAEKLTPQQQTKYNSPLNKTLRSIVTSLPYKTMRHLIHLVYNIRSTTKYTATFPRGVTQKQFTHCAPGAKRHFISSDLLHWVVEELDGNADVAKRTVKRIPWIDRIQQLIDAQNLDPDLRYTTPTDNDDAMEDEDPLREPVFFRTLNRLGSATVERKYSNTHKILKAVRCGISNARKVVAVELRESGITLRPLTEEEKKKKEKTSVKLSKHVHYPMDACLIPLANIGLSEEELSTGVWVKLKKTKRNASGGNVARARVVYRGTDHSSLYDLKYVDYFAKVSLKDGKVVFGEPKKSKE